MSGLDIAKKIVANNGNNHHYKIVKILREDGWYVSVSPYYTDNFSDKPREIDIIAEKEFFIDADWRQGSVNVQLYLECKYINDEVVFWFDGRNHHAITSLLTKTTALREDNTALRNHHYFLENLCAKLFASQKSNTSAEGDVFYKGITQALNGMIAYTNYRSILPVKRFPNCEVRSVLRYPVIVCNSFDKLFKLEVTQDRDPEQIDKIFQFETQYAYYDHAKNQRNDFFVIDICNEALLPSLFRSIQQDVNAVIQVIA